MKAIETVYKNRRFRSRLEARWAVFFDALGIKWYYEPQGFQKGDRRYLPDFAIDTQTGKFLVEVKGDADWLLDNQEHIDWMLSDPPIVAYRLILLGELPRSGNFFLFPVLSPGNPEAMAQSCFFSGFSGQVSVSTAGHLAGFLSASAISRPTYLSDLTEKQLDFQPIVADLPLSYPDISSAANMAARARFEHGETP